MNPVQDVEWDATQDGVTAVSQDQQPIIILENYLPDSAVKSGRNKSEYTLQSLQIYENFPHMRTISKKVLKPQGLFTFNLLIG